MDLPLAPIERILKRTHMRVSDKAVKEFTQLLEEIIADIGSEAAANSKRANRKTVLPEDIKFARKRIG